MDKKIRWRQRFHNLERAFLFLDAGLKRASLDELQEAGIIQSFEFTFELSWKTIKDFLEGQGTTVAFPRDVIKEAFQAEMIRDGHLWIEMLEKRNFLSHTYSQEQATKAVELIRERYFPLLQQVYLELKNRCSD